MEDPLKLLEDLFEPGDEPGVKVFPIPIEKSTQQPQATTAAKPKKLTREDYPGLARTYAERHGVDPDIFERQIDQESKWNRFAKSSKGALGLGQFMLDTGKRYGLKQARDFFNPEKSLEAAARHMKDLLDANDGDYDRALAAYNAGQGNVDKYKGVPPFKETRDYIKKIRGQRNGAASAIQDLTEPDHSDPLSAISDLFESDAQQPVAPNAEAIKQAAQGSSDLPDEVRAALGMPERAPAPLDVRLPEFSMPGAPLAPENPQSAIVGPILRNPQSGRERVVRKGDLAPAYTPLSSEARAAMSEFDDLKSAASRAMSEGDDTQGQTLLLQAKQKAAEINQKFGKQIEVGEGEGWPYIKERTPAPNIMRSSRPGYVRVKYGEDAQGNPIYREERAASPERIAELQRQSRWLIPSENVRDEQQLDKRLADLAQLRALNIQQGGPLDIVDSEIRKFTQVKNDLLRARTGGEFSAQAPSEGGRPADRPEDLPWYLKGLTANAAHALLSLPHSIEKMALRVEQMTGITPTEGFPERITAQERDLAEIAQRGGQGLIPEIQRGALGLAVSLPMYGTGSIPRLAAIGALEAGEGGEAPEPSTVIRQSLVNAALGGALKAGHALPFAARVPAVAALGAGASAAQGGTREQSIAQGMIFGALSALGGAKSFVKLDPIDPPDYIKPLLGELARVAREGGASPEAAKSYARNMYAEVVARASERGFATEFKLKRGMRQAAEEFGRYMAEKAGPAKEAPTARALKEGVEPAEDADIADFVRDAASRGKGVSPANIAEFFGISEERAARVYEQAKAPAEETASVPFMITREMRSELGRRGFSDAEIDGMRPEDARAELGKPTPETKGESHAQTIRRDQEILRGARSTGEEGQRDSGQDVYQEGRGRQPVVESEAIAARQAEEEVSDIDIEAQKAATGLYSPDVQPTEAQKAVGNYQKAHVKVAGLDVSIENPEGTKRRPEWPELKSHYGYIKKSGEAADGEQLDAFIKTNTDSDYSGPIYVIDQNKQDGSFDEHKTMIGFESEEAARQGYLENFTKDWKGLGAIRGFANPQEFKRWLKTADLTKPASVREIGGENITKIITAGKPSQKVDLLTAPQGKPATPAVRALRERVGQAERRASTAERAADTDPLTGAANRRALDRALPAAEADPNTSVISFDANNFGQVNKLQGEVAGDEMLKTMVNSITEAAREISPQARVFRRGGDEIVVLAPKTVADKIRAKAEERFGEHKIEGEYEGKPKNVTVSLSGSTGATFEGANKPLQQAKAVRKVKQAAQEKLAAEAATKAETQAKAQERIETAKRPVAEKPASIEIEKKAKTATEQARETFKQRKAERQAKAQGLIAAAREKAGLPEAKPAEIGPPAKPQIAGEKVTSGPEVEKGTKTGPVREPSRVTKAPQTEGQKRRRAKLEQAKALLEARGPQAELTPKGWKIADTSLKDARESPITLSAWDGDYLALNHAGLRALSKVFKMPVGGLSFTRKQGLQYAQEAKRLAGEQKTDRERENLGILSRALAQAADEREEFAIGRPLSQAHEVTHVAQLALKRFFERDISEEGASRLPEFKAFQRALVKKGYSWAATNPVVAAHEAAAHINNNQYEELGLTFDQAFRFMKGYFRLIESTYKADALKRFNQLDAKYQGIRDEIISRARQEETRRAATTNPARRDVQRMAERRRRGAAPAYAETTAGEEGPQADLTPQTESEEFKRWFGDSEVTDREGEPRVVYHGTGGDFTEFSPSKKGTATGTPLAELGFFFAENPKDAGGYATDLHATGGNTMPVYLSVERPYQMPPEMFDRFEPGGEGSRQGARGLRRKLINDGYDGVYVPHAGIWITFEPTQIKSAIGNRGTFDPNDPDILADLAPEDIPLPADVLAILSDVARDFLTEGNTDFNELAAEFEDALGVELFDELVDFLPSIVAAEEAKLQEAYEKDQKAKDTPAERTRRQELYAPRPPGRETVTGSPTSIVIPGTNKELPAVYSVRELEDVYPSHNPQNFNPNPDYELVNDRRYDREKAYQQEIIANSTKETFKPQRLINNSDTAEVGPPVIDSNGNVLGGNSRTMMLARVYDAGAGADYKAELLRQVKVYGLDVRDVSRTKRPVLVRVMTDETLAKQEAITDLNVSGTRALTPEERSVAEANQMPGATIDYIAQKIEAAGDDATLAQVLDRSGVEIVNRLIQDGVFQPQERNALTKDGRLLPEAKARIERMMLSRLFRDLDQLDRAPDYIKRNMERIAAPMARIANIEGWDISEDLKNAIDLATEARAAGQSNLDEFARQPSMLRPRDYTPREVALAKALGLGVAKTAKAFRVYAADATMAEQGGGLFGAKTWAEAFEDAFRLKEEPMPANIERVKPDYGTLERPNVPMLAVAFEGWFDGGGAFDSITEARAHASSLLGEQVKPGTEAAKAIDEAVELGVVLAARRIIAEGQSESATYDRLVGLYKHQQPTLGTKTSTSVRNQAYSTPIPIAYVASRLAGITPQSLVYEPTAGNGALLIEADPANVVANELNSDRAANLRDSLPGAYVVEQDAANYMPVGVFDVVITNPPFGVVKDAEGNSKTFYPTGEYRTNEIDHAIALRAIESIKDSGRAVLIVGGINAVDPKARSDGYNGKSKRAFYFTLYNNYNVVDHFTVDGDLYSKQGAGWPVDVIVIEGRGKSSRSLPAVDVPRIYDSFESLKEVLDAPYKQDRPQQNRVVSAREPVATGARSRPGSERAEVGRVGISEPAGRPVRADVSERAGLEAGAPARVQTPGERGAGRTLAGTERGGPGVDIRQPGAARGAVTEGRTGETAAVSGAQRPGSSETTGADQPATVAEPAARQAREPRPVTDIQQSQIPYAPHSAQSSAGTLVPVNMVTATDEALSKLEAQVGSLDEFVASELGYNPAEMGRYFNAEQVDALALAVRAMQADAGFIIGDQTGVGKGRVVAGIIRYAIRTGRTPIFVTEKPNLYKDIYRDLVDIGMTDVRPIMTNAGERIALTDDESVILKAKEGATHRKELEQMAAERSLGEHNIIFTTYSQMQTVKGARTARMDFLDAFAKGGVLILDESHNAGGTEKKDIRGKDVNEMNRAKFTRGLVSKASGVFYSSATYAKRPSVMDLYSKTDMRLAVKAGTLAEAIERGGVPLQQAVASQLVESGQYIRRERSFDGILYNTPPVKVNHQTAENISSVMRSIRAFDTAKQSAIENLKTQVKAEAKALMGETATGAAGVHSTNFTSLMHNLIDQMLLGLKADAAVGEAIAALKRGEKPVITVANTMGSFIEHYVEENDLKPGDALGLSFGDMLQRYLERSRDVLVGNAFGHKERKRLTDAELGAGGVAAYKRTKELIEKTDWSAIPVSPIDYMKSKIEAEGFKVGEITGRQHAIDYRGGSPTYRMRPGGETSIAGRNRTISRFNNGETDVMILNQAGATGLSLHASEKFKDQRKRHMIIAQAERNIDTHMQMLGRVHRTGQVVLPEYTQLAADIPAEKRPAAILAKKMASLNANTTAARGSAVTSKDAVDFMNDYGDEIVVGLMNDNPDLHRRLGNPLKSSESGQGLEVEGAIRKVTGRIPLLKIAEQEELYDIIESEYSDLIARLDAMGENALEAKMVDLDAKPIKKTVVFEGKGNRPFERSAHAETMDVKIIGRPHSSEEVLRMLNEHFGAEGETLDRIQGRGIDEAAELNRKLVPRYAEYRSEVLDEIEDQARMVAKQTMMNAQAERLGVALRELPVGATVRLKTDAGYYYGIVLKVEQKGNPKNPVALGSWKFTFAVADSMRRLTLPASQINGEGARQVEVVPMDRTEDLSQTPIFEYFDKSQQKSREQRSIITGNLLAGFSRFKQGKIVNFTDSEGAVRQGIMMPRDWSVEKAIEDEAVAFDTAEHVLKFIDETTGIVTNPEKMFRLSRRGADYRFFTPAAKATGGRYYLDQTLTRAAGQDFVKSGDMMQVVVDRNTAAKVIKAAQSRGIGFETDSFKDAARKITGKKKAQATKPTDEPMADLAMPDLAPEEEAQPVLFEGLAPKGHPEAGYITIHAPDLKPVKAAWDKFLNLMTRNLSHLRRVSPESHTAALRSGGSRGQATVLLSIATSKIERALEGSGIAWKDIRATLVESRLRGIRDRYQRFADDALNSSDEQLNTALHEGLFNILANIEGKAGLDDTLVQRAAAMLQAAGEPGADEDESGFSVREGATASFDSLRRFLNETFETAADLVGESMTDADYSRITTNPKFNDGLTLYKSLIEEPIAESHATNEGVFSDALGPLDTYYPLVAVKEDGGILRKIFGGTKYPYRKPKNIANYFATGLAEHGYSSEAEDFTERLNAAIRTNNKANLLAELDRQGLIRVLGRSEKAPEEMTVDGETVPATTVETRADLVIVRDGKSVRVPAARAVIPEWLHAELKPILDKEKLEPFMGQSIADKIIWYSLIGPADLIYHVTNLLGTFVANTPFIGPSLAGRSVSGKIAVGAYNVVMNTPLTKIFSAAIETARALPLKGEMRQEDIEDLIEMSKIGLIPPRYASVVTAWTRIGREYAKSTGAKAKRFPAESFLYGPKGFDIRGRLVLFRLAKRLDPNASPQEVFEFVSQLGIYNRELESKIERWFKAIRLAPFATAGTTMLRNGLNAWVGPLGTQPMVGGSGADGGGGDFRKFATRTGYRLAGYLSGGAAGLILMWAIAYKKYRDKWPWEDEEARLLQIPLNEKDRNSKLGQTLYGTDPTKTAYVNFSFFSPLVSRGSRALGLSGAFETAQLGGSRGQQFEYAQRDIMNSFAHPFTSGPLVRAPFVFVTGKEPSLTGFRDITGEYGPQFFPATVKAAPGMPALKQRAIEAILNVNPFFQSGAALAGVGKEGEQKPSDEKPARWVRMISDVVAPRLIGSSVDTLAKRERLAKERKAAESTPAPAAKMPDDVKLELHKQGIIPSKSPRKEGESDADYLKRSEAAGVEIAARIRALVKSDTYKAMSAESKQEALKRIIEDSRRDLSTAPTGETATEGEMIRARNIAEDDARARMQSRLDFQKLSGEQQKKALADLTRYFTNSYGVSEKEEKDPAGVRDARARARMQILRNAKPDIDGAIIRAVLKARGAA